MHDKFKHKLPKGMGNIEEAKPAVKAEPSKPVLTVSGMQHKPSPGPAPFTPLTGQMPANEVPPVVVAKPDPKPVPNAPNVKKGEGITYIGKYKKFHAEFKASGQTYNVGMFDTEPQAVAAIATAKAHLYP